MGVSTTSWDPTGAGISANPGWFYSKAFIIEFGNLTDSSVRKTDSYVAFGSISLSGKGTVQT